MNASYEASDFGDKHPLLEPVGASPPGRLFNALVGLFGAILLGFVCKRLKLVNPEAGDTKGLAFYTGQIALPLLIFQTVATAGFRDVDFSVVLACNLGKLAVVAVTWVLAFAAYKSSRALGQRVLTATIFAVYTFSTSDFAIGFPVVDALYGKTINMGTYITANSLAENIIFMPVTAALFQVGRSLLARAAEGEEAGGGSGAQAGGWLAAAWSMLVDVVTDPMILATLLGLLFKVLFGGWLVPSEDGGLRFASPLHETVTLFTSTFGMSALFLTGVNLRSASPSLWSIFLVLMKVVVSAYVSYFLGDFLLQPPASGALGGPTQMALRNFPFFYGAIPTGSVPVLFALQYDPGAVNAMASAVLFGTLLAGPILLMAAVFLQPGSAVDGRHLLGLVQLNLSAASIALGVCFLVTLLLLRRGWGFQCLGRFLLAAYGLLALAYEALVLSFNPRISAAACAEYVGSFPAWRAVAVGWLQNACRLVILALLALLVTTWKRPDYLQSLTLGWRAKWSVLVSCLFLALLPAFLVDPNTLLGICGLEVSSASLSSIDGRAQLTRNFVWSLLLLLAVGCLCVYGMTAGRLRGKAGVAKGKGKAAAAAEGEAADEEAAAAASSGDALRRTQCVRQDTGLELSDWTLEPPRGVVRSLVLIMALTVMTQVVNTFQVMSLDAIQGSFTCMLLLEMVLEHCQLLVLACSLLMDDGFVSLLRWSAFVTLPRRLFLRRRPALRHTFYVAEGEEMEGEEEPEADEREAAARLEQDLWHASRTHTTLGLGPHARQLRWSGSTFGAATARRVSASGSTLGAGSASPTPLPR